MNELEILKRKLQREIKAREEAEHLLEEKSASLFKAKEQLVYANQIISENFEQLDQRLKHTESTLLQEIEKRLETEAHHKAIVNAALDSIITINSEGTISYVNPSTELIFGYSENELVGENVSVLMDTPEREEHNQYLHSYFHDKHENPVGKVREVRGLHKNGTIIPLHLALSEFLLGDKTYFTGILRDIRQLKKVENHLSFQSNVLKEIAKGDSLQKVLDNLCISIESNFSDSTCSILSLDTDAKSLQVISGPHISVEIEDHLNGLIPGPQSASCGTAAHFAIPVYVDNCSLDVRWKSFRDFARKYNIQSCWSHPIFDDYNNVIGTFSISFTQQHLPSDDDKALLSSAADIAGIAIVRDRTMQDMQLAHAEAESASRSKSEFLANMSHEIRTPITAIAGYADLLAEPEGRNARDVKWAESIIRNAEHLKSLLGDILDLSKVEAGKIKIDNQPFKVSDIVDDVYQLFAPQAMEKLLDFKVDYDSTIPQSLICDPIRLRQIIINLVSNAIKFTSKGSITIRLSYRPNMQNELKVDVIDSGRGISNEFLSEIFNPFSHQHDTSRREGGTGLGLAISQRLANLMGGRIEIETKIDQGSTFSLLIPIEIPDIEEMINNTQDIFFTICYRAKFI
jgi:PAS domain S-box-containing protein